MRRSTLRAVWMCLVSAVAAVCLLAGVAHGAGPSLPTKKKGVLTVAIELGNPGFAEGTLGNPRGFSTDVARAVAKRLGLRIRFVNYPFARLFVPGAKPYDFALEFASITPNRARLVDFTTTEISSSQGVLVAKDVTGPVTLARLRTLQICAKELSPGFAYVQEVLKPTGLVFEYATAAEALKVLSTGICDAFVFDLPALLAAKRASPDRYGTVAGRVGAAERYGGLMPQGSQLLPAINKAIESLKRDGTMRTIAARHFGAALTSAPVIR